jgi:twitching motility protein PilT
MVYAILSDVQVAVFEARSELDLAYRVPDGVRFRVNVFRQRGEVGAVFRLIPAEIPALHSLGLPASVLQLTRKNCGLVLVTGPASSGKSTLLAAMLEEINNSRKAQIITIEDPVEFVFRPKNSEINQRQVGTDTENYVVALRQALRQDPDVILVDKLPDRETIAAAIAAAETGHLVFASLPTLGAVPTLQHLIHAFPVPMHLQMCERLANVVEGILTQVLVPGEAGEMACAREILIATPAVRARIQAGKLAQLPALMRNGKEGMTLLTQSFRQLRQRHNGGRMAFPDLRTLLETSRGDHHAA